MRLTGYHGTSSENAEKILKNGYNISDSEKEWLGPGIYFYFDYNDALTWRDRKNTVLCSVVECKDEEYLDIDSPVGKEIFNDVAELIFSRYKHIISESEQINQCSIATMIWDANKKLKVLSASVAKEPTKVKALIDARPTRKEFCVRDNSCITSTRIMKEDDLND